MEMIHDCPMCCYPLEAIQEQPGLMFCSVCSDTWTNASVVNALASKTRRYRPTGMQLDGWEV